MLPRCSLLLCFPLLLAPAPAHGQDFTKVKIKTTHVAGPVHMLQGRGGNMALCVGDDGAFLIDDQFAPLSEKILGAIQKVTPRKLRFVINTHWHPDHAGGNAPMKKAGATIVAHINVRRRMKKGQLMTFFNRKVPPAPGAALPLITFRDSITFHQNDETIQVVHMVPAHTDGDSLVKFKKANVLHTGDLFSNGIYPFIDGSSGGSLGGLIEAHGALQKYADAKTKIIPGHGPLGTRKQLVAYRAMLKTVRGRILKHLAAGKSVAEVVAAKPTRDFDPTYGGGWLKPDRWVKLVTGIEVQRRKAAAKRSRKP